MKHAGISRGSQVEVQHCHQHYKQEHRCWESAVSIKFIFLLSAAKANFEEATQTHCLAGLLCFLRVGVSQLWTSLFPALLHTQVQIKKLSTVKDRSHEPHK